MNQHNNKSKHINAIIYVLNPFVYKTTYGYDGILYKYWSLVKNQLQNKGYIVHETFTQDKNMNYDKIHKLVQNGKYDIGIANFTVVSNNIRHGVIYTRPIYLNKKSIAFIPKDNKLKTFFNIFFREAFIPLTLLIIISFMAAYVLERFSSRGSHFKSMWQILSGVIGQSGDLSEVLINKKLTWKKNFSSFIVVFFIMIFAFYFSLYLQARVNIASQNFSKPNDLTPSDISGKDIMLHNDSVNNSWLTNSNAKLIKVEKEQDDTKLFKDYIRKRKTNNNIVGFTDDIPYLLESQKKNSNVVISNFDYGYEEIAFMIHDGGMKDYTLQRDVDNSILLIQESGDAVNLCDGDKYFGKKYGYLCNI